MTINKLSDDVLLIIFEYLEAKSLLRASQVCKNWSDLIGSSTTTMKKLKLFLKKSNLHSIGEKVYWKHFNVVIQFGIGRAHHSQNDYFQNTMEKIADTFNTSNTRNLMFIITKKVDAHPLVNFLTLVPHLEDLKLYLEGSFNEIDASKMEHVVLSKLKKMEILWWYNYSFILTFLKAEQLLELKLKNYGQQRYADNVVINFLTGCTKLKKLTMTSFVFRQMFQSLEKYEFQLTHLKISFIAINPSFFQNFIRFLISQSTTLTNLVFHGITQNFEQILQTIFLIKHLSSLSINVYAIPKDNGLYRRLKPITTLKKLTIEKHYNSDDLAYYETALFIIEKCPNLQKLKLEFSYPTTFSHLSVLCPNLVELSIDCVKDFTDFGQGFVNLKYLEVICVSNMDNWMRMILNIPSIEALEVNYVSENQIIENHFEALLSQPTVSHLILRCGKPEDEDVIFCNTMHMNNNGELKTLTITFEKIHDLVMFELLRDTSQWHILEQKFLEKEILKSRRKNSE